MKRNSILKLFKKGYEECAEFYDLFVKNDDLAFYLEYGNKQQSPILDLACGTGRIAIPLAEAGHTVYCLDSSPAMLQIAKKKASDLPEKVRNNLIFIQSDITDFRLEHQFNLIIIPSSFGHCLTTELQLSSLKCIQKHLTKQGIFILDLFPGGTLEKEGSFTDKPKKQDSDHTVIRSGKYITDFINQISKLHLKFMILKNNKIIKEINVESAVAVIFNREIDLLLKIVGFEILDEYCDWNKTPYKPTINCKRRILILRKYLEE